MDYEKKYKESLEKARQLCAYPTTKPFMSDLQDLFPELKESSEDEQIRKWIIYDIRYNMNNKPLSNLEYKKKAEKAIAWLEKQGEQNPAEWHIEDEQMLNSCLSFLPDEYLRRWLKDVIHAKYEKQDNIAENEKKEFIGDGFIKCCADFQDFKEGETYWLEYLGDDDYNVRSDNLLGKTYHITPYQLYTIFKKQTCLEKQGEKKETLCDKCRKQQPSHSCQDITALGRCALEKQSEQSSLQTNERAWLYLVADVLTWKDGIGQYLDNPRVQELAKKLCSEYQQKLYNSTPFETDSENAKKDEPKFHKPKFHKGEFIKHNQCNLIYRINSVNDDYYFVENIETGGCFELFYITESNFHSWSFKDAKDGDILCTYELDDPKIVFMLRGKPKKHYALSYHCFYNMMYSYFESESEKGCLAPMEKDLKPATKEQRDILFQQMKKEGYEWDSEKKRIEKIEDEPENYKQQVMSEMTSLVKDYIKQKK